MTELWRIFCIPILFAALNAIGLFGALLSDGIGDVVSWLAFGVVVLAALRVRRSGRPRRQPVR